MSNVTSSSDQPFVMERRRFLVLGSAAAVAFAARGVSAAGTSAVVPADLPASLAVGFIDDGESRVASVLGASAVTAGDPSFISRSARVQVLGMWHSAGRRDNIGVALKTYYPTSVSVGGDIPVFGWAQRTRDAQVRSSFRVPIDDAGLRMEVEVNAPMSKSSIIENLRNRVTVDDAAEVHPMQRAAIAELKNTAALSVGIERGSAKLRPGTYVLAMLPEGASIPDWSSVRYTPSKTAAPITIGGILGDTPAPFDYILVKVDFAG